MSSKNRQTDSILSIILICKAIKSKRYPKSATEDQIISMERKIFENLKKLFIQEWLYNYLSTVEQQEDHLRSILQGKSKSDAIALQFYIACFELAAILG